MMVHWVLLAVALVVGIAVGWFARELGRVASIVDKSLTFGGRWGG